MPNIMSVLVLGDIVGQPGCRALFIGLKPLVKRFNADLVVVNGENAAAGLGITPQIVSRLLTDGVDVITSGNHVWQKREIYPVLDENDHVLRPANYPHCRVGRGYTVVDVKGTSVAVVNLQGRVGMSDIDCPFTVGKEIVRKLREGTKIILVDFHAEAAEEKEALAYWLNGMVTAVVGTHTHVQTADERILSGGTAYITDLGMIGPEMSVIGVEPATAIRRSMTQMPLKMPIADGPAAINGIHLTIDTSTGKALSMERVNERSRF
jgi:metallophosphoesterase (TIGR00282 family)